jgi:2-polyprenyl-3-methyl-5-hydroxy-6-metoxy-1,4-benzoquinol methylase
MADDGRRDEFLNVVQSEECVWQEGASENSGPGVYFTQTRWDLIELVPGTGNRVLEIGCGAGNTGEALKRAGKAVEVIGIERDPEAARWAAGKLDGVLQMSIEENTLALPPEYFDCIVAGDVLEHLQDPWAVVDRLRSCLKPGGHFIAGVPNVRNWRVLKGLVLAGRWQYAPSGILDRTHLRFFTKRSLAALFEHPNFRVERIVPRFTFLPRNKSKVCNCLTFGLFEEFLTTQYLIVVTRI